MHKPEIRRSFAEHLRYIAEITVAGAGEWRIRYDNGWYIVSHYGNWKGNFRTLEDALNAIPEYYRDLISRQLKKNQSEQLTLF